MNEHNRIQILSALNPYFRILRAYNPENFDQSHGITNRHNICFTVIVGALTGFKAIAIVLATWYLIDDDVAIQKVVIDIPVIITAIQSIVTFSALTINNYKINEMIIRLQSNINQRKCF